MKANGALTFDTRQSRTVKGLNLLKALYHSGGLSIPVSFRQIRQPIQFGDVSRGSQASRRGDEEPVVAG
jgi:hypothetical protein